MRRLPLLDAVLLSDVYIAMTRGQDSLAIGLEAVQGGAGAGTNLAERPLNLKVLRADGEELKRHAIHVASINEASANLAVWSTPECADRLSR